MDKQNIQIQSVPFNRGTQVQIDGEPITSLGKVVITLEAGEVSEIILEGNALNESGKLYIERRPNGEENIAKRRLIFMGGEINIQGTILKGVELSSGWSLSLPTQNNGNE
jgi:hypothetical protein